MTVQQSHVAPRRAVCALSCRWKLMHPIVLHMACACACACGMGVTLSTGCENACSTSTAQFQRPSHVPVMSQMAHLCGHNLRPTLSLCCIRVPPLVLCEALAGLHLRLQPSWRHVRLHVEYTCYNSVVWLHEMISDFLMTGSFWDAQSYTLCLSHGENYRDPCHAG